MHNGLESWRSPVAIFTQWSSPGLHPGLRATGSHGALLARGVAQSSRPSRRRRAASRHKSVDTEAQRLEKALAAGGTAVAVDVGGGNRNAALEEAMKVRTRVKAGSSSPPPSKYRGVVISPNRGG